MNPFKKISGKIRLLIKLTLWLLLILTIGGAIFTAWLFHDLPDIAFLKNRDTTFTIDVRDWQGETHPFQVGPENPYWTSIEKVPVELKWAVIAAEDASFYLHKGVDFVAIREALIYDLKQKRLARGASTIPQQLAKNLFLSRDKSILRKLRELVLAVRMEKLLSKDRILELYLNVVELGPLVYGVGDGARYHFGRPVELLTPAQSAILAAILPGPRVAFNPETRPERVRQRAARLLGLLGVRDVLNDEEIDVALTELEHLGRPPLELAPPEEPAFDLFEQ
ncbi:MAG: transglycosylase [Desulfuromonas sp.]|nr:MAG: transglycosylase [Desulfuromonas sp.]